MDEREILEHSYNLIINNLNKEIIQYTLHLIQDNGMDVQNIGDFMKGYFVSKFGMSCTGQLLQQLGRRQFENEMLYQEYVTKVANSEKLKQLLDEIV